MRTESDDTILVVADDGRLAERFADWLDEAGDAIAATTVAGAREQCDDDVDVVLLDRRLPDDAREALLAEIGGDARRTPVAVVTDVEPTTDLVEAPVDDYLVEPVGREDLLGAVDRLVRRGAYERAFREYFSLASRRAALRDRRDEGTLAGEEAYRELEARIAERERRADEAFAALADAEGVDAAYRGLGESG